MTRLQQSIAIFPQFIARRQETLIFSKGGFGFIGNDLNITLADGTFLFRTERHNFTGKKKVFDAAGNHIFTIAKSTMHALTDMNVTDLSDEGIIKLKNHFTMISLKASATFTDMHVITVTLRMKGGNSNVFITDKDSGVVVAQLARKTANFLIGKPNKSLMVSPGMDMAVIAAMSFEFIRRVMNR